MHLNSFYLSCSYSLSHDVSTLLSLRVSFLPRQSRNKCRPVHWLVEKFCKYEQPKQNVLQNHYGPICGNRLRKVIENIEIACVFDVRFFNVFAIK